MEISRIKNDTLTVSYKCKKVVIDITKELTIDDSLLNSQLMDSPSNYAFLCGVRDSYIKKRNKLEKQKDYQFSKLWLFYKKSNTKMTNDMATHQVMDNAKYQAIEKRFLNINYKAERLISICKAYESRERILQTLSANLRRQL